MKKVVVFAALAMISLASCKKDYTCNCTTTNDGVQQASSSYTITDHLSDAEAKCNEGDSQVGGVKTECDLDKI